MQRNQYDGFKGENSVLSNTLINLLVTYWKEDGLEPPTVLPPAKLSQEVKDAMSEIKKKSNPCW